MGKSVESIHQWSVAQLGIFFTQNRNDLLSFARQHLRDPQKAEEIVQDALVKVILASPELSSAEHALAYFRKAIQNLIIDHHRAEGRQPQLILLEDLPESAQGSFDDVAEHFNQLASADDAVIIREALSLLSPAERTALVMWEIEGRSISEIASELGVRESSVRHTTSRARASMRRILSERIIDPVSGLTALDLLSKSYKKVGIVAKKSSRVALSMALVLSAFLGFSQLSSQDILIGNSPIPLTASEENSTQSLVPNSPNVDTPKISDKNRVSSSVVESPKGNSFSESQGYNLNSTLGSKTLEDLATPSNSIVSDASGLSGELFLGDVTIYGSESGLMWSNIVSTKNEGPQVLISQSVILDEFGASYVASASIGLNGWWTPLNMAFVTSDIERLESGNYLLSALFDVESSMPLAVAIPTAKRGNDFTTTPEFIATKLVLDPSKTRILAQSVLISATSQEGKA